MATDACLCGCPRTDHEGGDGPCACGCPLWRPWRPYSPEDERRDRQHDGMADEFLRAHSLRIEVTDEHAWLLLPLPEGEA